MRINSCVPGGMPALLQRLEDPTLKIWQRIGVRTAGFFTTLVGPNNHDLTDFRAWGSLAEREQVWNTVASDPEWVATHAAYQEKHGERGANIAASFLTPTAFSTVK